jgi:HNH endonuclease
MKSWRCYSYAQKYCGRGCANASRPRKHFIDKHGYRLISVNGKQIPEHRLVMSRKIGRELFADETVHHKNGDRLNNSLDNLELWSNRHGKGQRVEDRIVFMISFLRDYGYKVFEFVKVKDQQVSTRRTDLMASFV